MFDHDLEAQELPAELLQFLGKHMDFCVELETLCSGAEIEPGDKRQLALEAMNNAAFRLVEAQASLIALENPLPAFTLVRPTLEHVVRSVWIRACASDTWIEKYWTPKPNEAIAETASQSSLKEMISALGKSTHTAQIASKFDSLYQQTGKAMHSLVHGGIYSTVQSLSKPDIQQATNLLRNSNGMLLISAQALLLPYANWQSDYRSIQSRFLGVLPPLDSPQTFSA